MAFPQMFSCSTGSSATFDTSLYVLYWSEKDSVFVVSSDMNILIWKLQGDYLTLFLYKMFSKSRPVWNATLNQNFCISLPIFGPMLGIQNKRKLVFRLASQRSPYLKNLLFKMKDKILQHSRSGMYKLKWSSKSAYDGETKKMTGAEKFSQWNVLDKIFTRALLKETNLLVAFWGYTVPSLNCSWRNFLANKKYLLFWDKKQWIFWWKCWALNFFSIMGYHCS